MKRSDKVLTAISVVALVALAVVGADDLHRRSVTDPLRRKLENGHASYVQTCVLNDESQAECEARWLRALGE